MMSLLAIAMFVDTAVGTRLYMIQRDQQQHAALYVMIDRARLHTLFMIVAIQKSPFDIGDRHLH